MYSYKTVSSDRFSPVRTNHRRSLLTFRNSTQVRSVVRSTRQFDVPQVGLSQSIDFIWNDVLRHYCKQITALTMRVRFFLESRQGISTICRPFSSRSSYVLYLSEVKNFTFFVVLNSLEEVLLEVGRFEVQLYALNHFLVNILSPLLNVEPLRSSKSMPICLPKRRGHTMTSGWQREWTVDAKPRHHNSCCRLILFDNPVFPSLRV